MGAGIKHRTKLSVVVLVVVAVTLTTIVWMRGANEQDLIGAARVLSSQQEIQASQVVEESIESSQTNLWLWVFLTILSATVAGLIGDYFSRKQDSVLGRRFKRK